MTTDAELAIDIAKATGQILLKLRTDFGPVDPQDKERRKELKDLADRTSHVFIRDRILAARPGDALLSEEGTDRTERDTADRVWIVDPLDGTSEYGQNRADFAVHIALWERDQPDAQALTVGVVDLPAQGITLTTIDDVVPRTTIAPGEPVRIVVSRSRPPELTAEHLAELTEELREANVTDVGVEVLNVGSVGAKVAEVIGGRADAYAHDSGFYEWDAAAPLAVAHHYGLTGRHLDDSVVTFNHRPPWVKNFVVCLDQLAPFVFTKSRGES